MSWRLTTLDGNGRESLSSAVPSRSRALDWAASLRREGTRVVRITGPDDVTIEGAQIDEVCRDIEHRRSA